MTTDYSVLMQKFNNFKNFIKETSNETELIKRYESMSDNSFLLFGLSFLLPNRSKLDVFTKKLSQDLKLENKEHIEKLERYLNCFCEYLEQLNTPEMKKQVIEECFQEIDIESLK